MARDIQAFRLRTQIEVDNAKAAASLKATERDVDKLGQRFTKLGPEIDKALKGKELGAKFGQQFSSSATALITGSFDSFGQTLGSIIGTAVAPGLGTVIGSTLGSGFDKLAGKALGILGPMIQQGIELNKVLESTTIEFTTFVGSEQEAKKYLSELVQLSGDIGILPTTLIESSEKLYDLTGNLKLTRSLLKAAADQAQDFGGSIETFHKIADALGLIAEKGNLSKNELKQLYKAGIKVPEILAEAFGKTPEEIKRLMAAGRIRGEIAAGLVAAAIERDKGGYAALQAKTSLAGRQRRYEALSMIRAGEGTRSATQAISDFYGRVDEALSGPAAQKFVSFLDEKIGTLINMVEKASRAGINLAEGIGTGLTSGDALGYLKSSFVSLGDYTEKAFKDIFEIQSPSERMAREIGIPMGEGLANGIADGFTANFKGQTTEQIVATLDELLQDPRVSAFFEAIRKAEGGAPNRIVGGRTVSDLSRHPNIVGVRTAAGPSTAFGNYQITGTNWYGKGRQPGLQQRLNLPDASAHSQLLAAAMLFAERDGGAGIRALLAGDIDKAMRVAAKDWTSTPGSTIGGGGQKSKQQWMGYFNQALGANGSPVTAANPMPVIIVRDQLGGASAINWSRQSAFSTSVSFDENSIRLDPSAVTQLARTGDLFKDLVPAIAAVNTPLKLAVDTTNDFGLGIPPLTKAEQQLGDRSIHLKKVLKELEEEFGFAGIAGAGLISQLAGAIGQISGMLPTQQVGRKRGFFSKLLGVAAPFLSFIPGVGGILSTIAGMASGAVGGNFGAIATGLASGLQPGGVFRSRGTGGGGGGGLARGGPVRRGTSYIVGENGPELFTSSNNGWIHPRVGAQGGGTDPAVMELLQRVASSLDRFDSMPPDHVVMKGARGLIKAYDQDAGLIRLSAQRHRLQ